MRYIYLNVFCIGMLVYAINLAANTNQEPEKNKQEQKKEEKPDYDKMARDLEKDAEVHSSWGTWGYRN